MKKFVILVLVFVMTATYADATAIVIVANPTEIYVAADTKLYRSEEKICKIYQIGSVYWAMSGVTANSVTGYDVARIVKQSYATGQSVEKTLDSFDKRVREPLAKTLTHLSHYPIFEAVRRHPLEIAFWAFEHGKPIIGSITYTSNVNGNQLTLSIVNRGLQDCSAKDQECAVFLGVKGKSFPYAQTKDWGPNLASAAHMFMDMSLKEAPDTVGKPIEELIILPDGNNHWATSNKYCVGKPCAGPPPEPQPTKSAQ